MSTQNETIKPAQPGTANTVTKPLIAIYDAELDLAVQLREADAREWGRDPTMLKKISNHAQLHGAGKGGLSGEPGSANKGKNYGAASNSGDNTGMNSTGTTHTTGVPTETGEGVRFTGSAGTESHSANENKQ